MGFIKRLLEKFRKDYDEYDEEEWEEEESSREIDFNNREQRNDYVRNCLEKMAEATKELENLNFEYNMVTSYLKDMEEIEALPPEESEQLKDCARRVALLQERKTDFMGRPHRITDEKYRMVERMEDQMEEAFEKITEAENYQELIRKDLSRLEGEKHAYLYRKSEVMRLISDTKGMAVICVTALGLCALLLLFLQFFLEMDTQLGYLATAGAAAIAITMIYVKHMDARRELKRVETGINKIILLQNKVKIRYVNNKNLLDYYYIKYDVDSGKKLEKLYHQYLEEKEQRKQFAETEARREYYHKQLLAQLGRYRIRYPDQLSGNVTVILDHREQVERRHELILRRQSLRKQMDYNNTVAGEAKQEIKDIVMAYPRYAAEITEMVDRYDSVYRS